MPIQARPIPTGVRWYRNTRGDPGRGRPSRYESRLWLVFTHPQSPICPQVNFLRLPRMQKRVEVDPCRISSPLPPPSRARANRRWIYDVSMPFSPPPPPSHTRASRRWIFDVSMPSSPPPPPSHIRASPRRILSHFDAVCSCTSASWRWFMTFRRRSRLLHLPRIQERAGAGFLTFRCRPRLLHLPRIQERAGGVFLSHFDTVCLSSTSLAYRCELEVVRYCLLTLFGCLPPPSRTSASWRWSVIAFCTF